MRQVAVVTRNGAAVVAPGVGEGRWAEGKISAGLPCTTASGACVVVVGDMGTEGASEDRSEGAYLVASCSGFAGCRWLVAA